MWRRQGAMLHERQRGNVVAAAALLLSRRALTNTTPPRRQLQQRDRVLGGTHGAGFVKHESLATNATGTADATAFTMLRNSTAGSSGSSGNTAQLTRAAPAADLHRTQVHEGLGTSARDPYVRTLPNMPSQEPESTVLAGVAATAPTHDERARLSRRWAALQYWLAEQHPRLPLYVAQQLVVDDADASTSAAAAATTMTPATQRLLDEFAPRVLPAIMEGRDAADVTALRTAWLHAVDAYTTLATATPALLLDRHGFVRQLTQLHERTRATLHALCPREEVTLALAMLRRRAVWLRNTQLQTRVLSLLVDGDGDGSVRVRLFGCGDAVWAAFFDAVAQHKARIFATDDSEGGNSGSEKDDSRVTQMLAYAWQALALEDVPRTPTVTAPVALYMTLLSVYVKQLSPRHDERDDAAHNKSSNSTTAAVAAATTTQRYADVDVIVRRRFCMTALQAMLRDEAACAALARALREAQLLQLSRDAALCAAVLDDRKLREADCADVVDRFHSRTEVTALLSAVLRGGDAAARAHVMATFALPTPTREANVAAAASLPSSSWERVLADVDWGNNWRQLTTTLLSDTATLSAMHKHIRNMLGVKSAVGHLFSEDTARALHAVLRTREARAATRVTRGDAVVAALSSYDRVDATVAMLERLGADMTELDVAAAAAAATTPPSSLQTAAPPATAAAATMARVDGALLLCVLRAVAARHPSWVAAGVLPSHLVPGPAQHDAQSTPSSLSLLDALRVAVRMYVRLSYVPQAGVAAIAQHTRRRVGAVGLAAHEHNIPAEVGIVEHYNNLQYKRYDWQGWYQRMVDVHNRNVSVRCRIDDLKRLDAQGCPFVDLQTERRLRVLASDRVGMGVVKLDSDRYEDQADNLVYGSGKLSELLADARKAQLGPEYWPTVEVKVRRPSGQSQAHYSLIDHDRIEQQSKQLYERYRDAKKHSLFVTPMDLWLEVRGVRQSTTTDNTDAHGYTIDNLHNALDERSGGDGGGASGDTATTERSSSGI